MTDNGACDWLFVIGPSRSGTTPVRFLLNAHPDCFIMHEGFFIQRFSEAERHQVPTRIPHHELVTIERDGKPEQQWRETQQYVWTPDDPEFPTLYDACLALRRTYPPVQVFGDKMPGASNHWQRIMQLLPGARFIVTLRDEAEILKSIKRRSKRDAAFAAIMARIGDVERCVKESLKQAWRCADATGACVVIGDDLDEGDVVCMLDHAGLDEARYDWDAARLILSEGVRVS